MNKSDIKNGMHVITKDGTEYVIMSNIYAPKQIDDGNTAKVVMLCLNGGWINFDKYSDDLCFHDTVYEAEDDDCMYDIDEVYVPNYYCWTLESALESKNKNDFTKLWKRGVPKMTKEEIEAILGYEIEIID